MNCWTTLGIQPSGDVQAIRRAYAARLKAIDVDADPAGFIALRSALEQALTLAARPAPGTEPAPVQAFEEVAWDEGADPDEWLSRIIHEAPPPLPRPLFPAPAPPPPAAPQAPAGKREAEDPNARFAALDQLLFGDEPEPDPAALADALFAIIDHDEMERLDHAARVEDWLAESLWQAIPRADPIIPIVVTRFGWEAELDAARRRPYVTFVARRADDLGCMARLASPDHRWHEAWVRLGEPPSGGIGLADRLRLGPEIAQLLISLRTHYPEVEHERDPGQIALWDRTIGRRAHLHRERGRQVSWYGWLCIGWLLFNAAALSARLLH